MHILMKHLFLFQHYSYISEVFSRVARHHYMGDFLLDTGANLPECYNK